MLTQPVRIVPPIPSDVGLRDFSQGVQLCFQSVFQNGHVHSIVTTAPTATTGNIGDIYLVNLSGTIYLYAKLTSSDWYKVQLTAA